VDAELRALGLDQCEVVAELLLGKLARSADRLVSFAAKPLDDFRSESFDQEILVQIVCRPAAELLAASLEDRWINYRPEKCVLSVAAFRLKCLDRDLP